MDLDGRKTICLKDPPPPLKKEDVPLEEKTKATQIKSDNHAGER